MGERKSPTVDHTTRKTIATGENCTAAAIVFRITGTYICVLALQ